MQKEPGNRSGGSGIARNAPATNHFLRRGAKPATMAALLATIYLIKSTPLSGPPAYLAPAGVGSVVFALLARDAGRVLRSGWAVAVGTAIGIWAVAEALATAVFGISINAVTLDPLSAIVGFLFFIPLALGIEAARAYIIRLGKGRAAVILGTAALMALILIPYGRLAQLTASRSIAWVYAGRYLIPAFFTSLVASELVRWWGFRASLAYTLTLAGAAWLLPYLPSTPWYAYPIIYSAMGVTQILAFLPEEGWRRREKRLVVPRWRALADKSLTAASLALLIAVTLGLAAGYRAMVVVSGSMEPSIQRGDIVISSPTAEVSVGDVVAYASPQGLIVHRVVDEEVGDAGLTYRTKGDANNAPDPWTVPRKAILGKVIAVVPYVGYPLYYLSSLLGGFSNALVAILVAAFFSFYLYVRFIGGDLA